MVFGGYFSSRLVENIRERRGYTYSPRSSVEHQVAGSSFLVEADVATEVTAPALLETWYELGRMALTPVTEAELEGARRYVLGSMALSTATHAGLASTLSALVGAGLSAPGSTPADNPPPPVTPVTEAAWPEGTGPTTGSTPVLSRTAHDRGH